MPIAFGTNCRVLLDVGTITGVRRETL